MIRREGCRREKTNGRGIGDDKGQQRQQSRASPASSPSTDRLCEWFMGASTSLDELVPLTALALPLTPFFTHRFADGLCQWA